MVGEKCPVSDMSLEKWTKIKESIDAVMEEFDGLLTGEWDEKLDYRATLTGYTKEITVGIVENPQYEWMASFVKTHIITACFGGPFSITVTDVRNGTVLYAAKDLGEQEFLDELSGVLMGIAIHKIDTVERYTVDFRHKKVKNRMIVDIVTKSKESDYY